MNISLSQLKENPAKYFHLAKETDITVTKRGMPLGRIICEEKAAALEKKAAIEALIGSVQLPNEYKDSNYDPDYEKLRDTAYKDRDLL
ncbi:MAG: type II toxin-antitoxin system prevent-host-death family antitoxin [Oscillospiraceae bacterium]|nr:type II toxin-antitoxin system prevent-host-death family antitoxin [Oscillospiraceae bacterium]